MTRKKQKKSVFCIWMHDGRQYCNFPEFCKFKNQPDWTCLATVEDNDSFLWAGRFTAKYVIR